VPEVRFDRRRGRLPRDRGCGRQVFYRRQSPVSSDGREFDRLVEVTVPAAGQKVRTVHGQNLATVTEARVQTNGVPYVIADGLTLELYQIVGITKRTDLTRPCTKAPV
jgi:hypothetical protein